VGTHILVTGGAGFIGSNFVQYVAENHSDWSITNLDKLTYAGSLENVEEMEGRTGYRFVKGDICEREVVEPLVAEADIVINFAAETHVDRSIHHAGQFILTDVYGTFVLLEAMRLNPRARLFVQISTDEVYGEVLTGAARETDPLMPRNPYSASKAGADRLAYSYHTTYGMPILVTRASNNYGPRQYPEKVIPLFVTNALEGRQLPLYGDGLQVRDWLHVEDHCRALDLLFEKGELGETYNIGGGTELTNLVLTEHILDLVGKPKTLIQPVKDRPGHDRRYALDTTKLRQLGWSPEVPFENGLASTVEWYRRHADWWKAIKSGSREYRRFYEKHYGDGSAGQP
jgi:dTDP-glucose 4,6-dehydratase